jgi:hypothetical protein
VISEAVWGNRKSVNWTYKLFGISINSEKIFNRNPPFALINKCKKTINKINVDDEKNTTHFNFVPVAVHCNKPESAKPQAYA